MTAQALQATGSSRTHSPHRRIVEIALQQQTRCIDNQQELLPPLQQQALRPRLVAGVAMAMAMAMEMAMAIAVAMESSMCGVAGDETWKHCGPEC